MAKKISRAEETEVSVNTSGPPQRPSGDSSTTAPDKMADAAEMLWVVLANVSGGDWTKQSQEWQEAAARWRDNYFATLKAAAAPVVSHTKDCAVWRGVSAHPESEPLPCDCGFAAPVEAHPQRVITTDTVTGVQRERLIPATQGNAPELLNELRITVRRLELCIRHSGSTREFAEAATAQTWELIRRIEQGQS